MSKKIYLKYYQDLSLHSLFIKYFSYKVELELVKLIRHSKFSTNFHLLNYILLY